jgi:hypothetical protein
MSAMIPQIRTYDDFVNALPCEYQARARGILKKILPVLDINDRVFYRDGTLGSNLLDLLNHYFMPDEYDRPPDFNRFVGRVNESDKKWLHLQ